MALSGEAIPKRYSHYANGTASRPQGSPFRATGAFSRGTGEAASGGPGRAGAVSARAVGEGRIASGAMKPLRICGRNRREDAAERHPGGAVLAFTLHEDIAGLTPREDGVRLVVEDEVTPIRADH